MIVAPADDEAPLRSRLRQAPLLLQGPAHRVESESERAFALAAVVENWAPGDRELFVRIVPSRITGRRIRPA
jgi:hypothetical protein